MTRHAVSPLWVVLVASLWMALAGNGALWRQFGELGLLASGGGWAFAAAMLLMIWAALAAILGLAAWRFVLKPVATLLIVATALASHFMLSYRVVIDPGMITNALQTDAHEAGALANGRLFLIVALLALLPAWLLWRQPVAYGSLKRQLWRSPATVAAALAVMLLATLACFQPLASLMRNHKEVRYLINPLNSLYAVGRVAFESHEPRDRPLLPVGADARLGAAYAGQARPPVLLLVVGETARGDHFGLNGYPRPTTPELAREGALSFGNAWSCGTSTAVSVPCMFSNLTREHLDDGPQRRENLLDVLQRAGLAVLWLDNQAGCKGVCARVPHADTSTLGCDGGECLDGAMLDGLDERIAALDPARRAKGIVLVMHQMGSHGPAYAQRSPAGLKPFQPECTSTVLSDCSAEGLVNAYDNSIAYTDHMLARAIGWLKRQPGDTAMLYVSDHGESLGENNLYLHGMPYAIAPDVQKHVAWVSWLSPGFARRNALDEACLSARRDQPVSHDHYFHSVLGLMDVQTQDYRSTLDAYAACRGGRVSQKKPVLVSAR